MFIPFSDVASSVVDGEMRLTSRGTIIHITSGFSSKSEYSRNKNVRQINIFIILMTLVRFTQYQLLNSCHL